MVVIANEEILSFDEMMKQSVEDIGGNLREPALLLGNGYSMALRPDIFSYSKLKNRLDPAGFKLDTELLQVFADLGTDDFEQVIHILQNTHYIAAKYPLGNFGQILGDIQELKDQLVEAITQGHPRTPDDGIVTAQYDINKIFLSKFGKIFTTNYDLLLYWSINRNSLTSKFTDGFKSNDGVLYWEGEKQNVYWLHGGLHLYLLENEKFINFTETIKLKTEAASTLIEQIEEKLNTDNFPITVAEGDWKSKAKKISSSPFLRHGFKAMSQNSRNIVTFGIGFDQDAHIVKAISESKAQKIFVGIHQPTITNVTQQRAKLAPLMQRHKTIQFYDSGTVTIW